MIAKFESNAFENCANITVLDLRYNQITSIPRRTFDENTYATELALSYNMLEDLSQVRLSTMSFIRQSNARQYENHSHVFVTGATSQHDRFENSECFSQPHQHHTKKHISQTLRIAHHRYVAQQFDHNCQRCLPSVVLVAQPESEPQRYGADTFTDIRFAAHTARHGPKQQSANIYREAGAYQIDQSALSHPNQQHADGNFRSAHFVELFESAK